MLWAQAWKPGSQHAGEKRGVAGLLLGRTERAARAAELQLCAQARERRAPAERLLWPGRASPSAPQLLAFSPGKEQAAGVWETCLAPGWPQLRSGLPFGPRSQASLQKAQGPGVCKLPKPPASRALCQAKRAPRAAFPSGCLAAQTKRWAEGSRVPAPLPGRGSTTARGILRLCPESACQTGLPWSSPPA